MHEWSGAMTWVKRCVPNWRAQRVEFWWEEMQEHFEIHKELS
jgi:hypothetical protein